MSRLTLQTLTVLIALATIGLGGVQVRFGIDSPLYRAASVPNLRVLDSNLRFFGGMALGLGLILLWTVPSIERKAPLFRAVWVCALAGGIGRLISLAAVGSPSELLVGFTVLEVIGAPLLMYWQSRIALSTRPTRLASPGLMDANRRPSSAAQDICKAPSDSQ